MYDRTDAAMRFGHLVAREWKSVYGVPTDVYRRFTSYNKFASQDNLPRMADAYAGLQHYMPYAEQLDICMLAHMVNGATTGAFDEFCEKWMMSAKRETHARYSAPGHGRERGLRPPHA